MRAAPMRIASVFPSNIEPLATLYAMRMSGNVTSADDCCAAAALDTRAEIARIIASARAMNGGSTQNIRSHQLVVGKNQPPTSGPTSRFTIKRVEPEADERGEVPGDERGDELAEVDLAFAGGGVGEKLAAATLALTDDGVGADGRRHGERHHDRERREQVDGECVRRLHRTRLALDVLLDRGRQRADDVAELLTRARRCRPA